MGTQAKLLLVKRVCLLILSLIFSSNANSASTNVDAEQYQSFWLWAGVRPQPVLHKATELYIHQGEIAQYQNKVGFFRQGIAISKLNAPAVWLSIRFTTLDVPEPVLLSILNLRQNWINQGNNVLGIQVDFDAGSYQLDKYAVFLAQLREKLPADCKLSVTGLLDWAKTGDINQLNTLAIDELVIQTYQGKNTVTNYHAYLPALVNLTIPFRIGLVQQGIWDTKWQQHLALSPYYRGEVVFLLNSDK